MTSSGTHLMSEACLFLSQKQLLKRPSMASSRGGISSCAQEKDKCPLGFPLVLSSEASSRRPLSPVRECIVVTDVTDSRVDSSYSSGSTTATGQEQRVSQLSQHESVATAADVSLPSSQPLAPVENESNHRPVMCKGEEEEIVCGSASASDKPTQRSLPQHEMDDPKAQDAAILQRNKALLLRGLSLTSAGGNLTLINLSRRGLGVKDAKLLKRVMHENPHLSVLKLAYNNLGDQGAAILACGFLQGSGHHKNLSVFDLGFNSIGDVGCAAIALHAVAGNRTLSVLYLSGNNIGEKGSLSLAGAMLHGCSLTSLHLSANSIGVIGIQALCRAVAENEACKNTQRSRSIAFLGNCSTDHAELKTMEELYLGETAMSSGGFVSIPSMLLTNMSLRVLCLSNNGIDDQGMALLSQALSRNKCVPLESVELSFNEITCAGVECLMNAIWGSPTLRKIKLDNNRIRDRGAQLAAVVLTSVNLEVLDIGFNRVTNVGIKALMKSLSENNSLKSLSLSGIPLDALACKAVSYALAHNSSLRTFYIDNCQIGYTGQRHIAAGIVSNRQGALRVLTGFELGAIAVTLQMPQLMETWTNDQVLRFVHFMWKIWEESQAELQRLSLRNTQLESTETPKDSAKHEGEVGESQAPQIGPATPSTVVAAAKKALALIGEDADDFHLELYGRNVSEMCPLVSVNATLLERTHSGTLRVPPIVESNCGLVKDLPLDISGDKRSQSKAADAQGLSAGPSLDPLRKNRNLQWLRVHFRSLNEVANLPFNSADLWQLHQYFFSPVIPPIEHTESADSTLTSDTGSTEERTEEKSISSSKRMGQLKRHSRTPQCSPMPMDASQRANLGRTISFQMLGEAALSASSSMNLDSIHKRRSVQSDDEEDEEYTSSGIEPASKRAKNLKPRVASYPRIREKLEALRTKPSQKQTLALLRLLKFVESVMFHAKNPFTDATIRDPQQPSPADVEMIILDLL